MGIFEGVLLVSDFDGTLTDSKGQIPDLNIMAIKDFISEGGKFTISTGRTKVGFHNYDKSIINAPIILGNGAMGYDYLKNFIAFVNAIDAQCIDTLHGILREFEDIGMEVYGVDNKTYVINPNELNFSHFSGLKIDTYNVVEELNDVMFPVVKIMLSVGTKTFEVQDFLNKISLDTLKYIPSNGNFLEILSKNSGKGPALLQLADVLDIAQSNVYAIGDASNDVDMLKTAKKGFVPLSGDTYAKRVASDIVCSSDDGAVADAIRILREIYS